MFRFVIWCAVGCLYAATSVIAQTNPTAAGKVNLKDCCKATYKNAKKKKPSAQEEIAHVFSGAHWWDSIVSYADAAKWYDKRLKHEKPLSARSLRDLTKMYRFGGYGITAEPTAAAQWLVAYNEQPEAHLLLPDRLDADMSRLDTLSQGNTSLEKLLYGHLILEQHLSYPIGKYWLKQSQHPEAAFLLERWEVLRQAQKDDARACAEQMRPVWAKHPDSQLARLEWAAAEANKTDAPTIYARLLPLIENPLMPELQIKAAVILAQTQTGVRQLVAQRQVHLLMRQYPDLQKYSFAESPRKVFIEYAPQIKDLHGLAQVLKRYGIQTIQAAGYANASAQELIQLSAALKSPDHLPMYGEERLRDYLSTINDVLLQRMRQYRRLPAILELDRQMERQQYTQYLNDTDQDKQRDMLLSRLLLTLKKPRSPEALLAVYQQINQQPTQFIAHPQVKAAIQQSIRGQLSAQVLQFAQPRSLFVLYRTLEQDPAWKTIYPDYAEQVAQRAQEILPNPQARQNWYAYATTNFETPEQAEQFAQRCRSDGQLLEEIQEQTLKRFFTSLEAVAEAPEWLQPRKAAHLSRYVAQAYTDDYTKQSMPSFDLARVYFDSLSRDSRLQTNEKTTLQRLFKFWSIAQQYGEDPDKAQVQTLQDRLEAPENAWLLPEGKDAALNYLNNQSDFFTGIHPKEDLSTTYNYKVYTSSGADKFAALTKTADQGYILEVYQISDGMNEKIFHTFVGTQQTKDQAIVRFYYPEQSSYNWKPKFDSFVACHFMEGQDQLTVKQEGNMQAFYDTYHDFTPEDLKTHGLDKPLQTLDKKRVRAALRYFIFAYEPILLREDTE